MYTIVIHHAGGMGRVTIFFYTSDPNSPALPPAIITREREKSGEAKKGVRKGGNE